MDGELSENYEYFRTLIVRGFLEIRKHADRLLLLVELMLSGKTPNLCSPEHHCFENARYVFCCASFQNAVFRCWSRGNVSCSEGAFYAEPYGRNSKLLITSTFTRLRSYDCSQHYLPWLSSAFANTLVSGVQCIQKVVDLIDTSVNNWRTIQYDTFQRITNGIF